MNFEEILGHPAFWVVVAAASELIGMSKLKDNSIIQFLFTAIRSIRPGKKGGYRLTGVGSFWLTHVPCGARSTELSSGVSFTQRYPKN